MVPEIARDNMVTTVEQVFRLINIRGEYKEGIAPWLLDKQTKVIMYRYDGDVEPICAPDEYVEA